ncbi:MAG: hypothetical protein RLZZ303_2247 [Candidatus Hydrogenedentota bacterium]
MPGRRALPLLLALLLGCLAPPALAAPAPARAGDPLLPETLAMVEDLLRRFEETAASHHVLLTGAPAAQRSAALRLASLARAHAASDPAAARRYLGWAAAFPGLWWYARSLPARRYHLVAEAAAAARPCAEDCPGLAPPGDAPAGPAARPYIQPNQLAANPGGGYDALLDFIHYPPGRFDVTISCEGQVLASGRIAPGATVLRAPARMGVYEVSAALPGGPVLHHYRAPAILCDRNGLRINGAHTPLKMARMEGMPSAGEEETTRALEDLRARGFNALLVAQPPAWLLTLAARLELGLVVQLDAASGSPACAACPEGEGLAAAHARLRQRMRPYIESPAVWLWALSALGTDAEAHAEIALPLLRQADPYERPILMLGETTLAPMHEVSAIPLRPGAPLDALAPMKQRADARDLALLVDAAPIDGATPDPALWSRVMELGCAGVILETLRPAPMESNPQ